MKWSQNTSKLCIHLTLPKSFKKINKIIYFFVRVIIIIIMGICRGTSTEWLFVHWNLDRIGIWKCWFLGRVENKSTRRKTSRSREENQQQTQPTYCVESGNRSRTTSVGGECSHHCPVPAKNIQSLFAPDLVEKDGWFVAAFYPSMKPLSNKKKESKGTLFNGLIVLALGH